jgi:hypothetical protein
MCKIIEPDRVIEDSIEVNECERSSRKSKWKDSKNLFFFIRQTGFLSFEMKD